jgi:hypothetical protein
MTYAEKMFSRYLVDDFRNVAISRHLALVNDPRTIAQVHAEDGDASAALVSRRRREFDHEAYAVTFRVLHCKSVCTQFKRNDVAFRCAVDSARSSAIQGRHRAAKSREFCEEVLKKYCEAVVT